MLLSCIPCYTELHDVHAAYVRSAIGHSVMEMDIALYRVPERAGKPKVLVVGNIHGDEVSGFDLVVSMLQHAPDADLDVVYLPSMNPDGMYYDMRENADRVDLNRAFPDACRRVNSTITPESQAVMDWVAAERPLVVLVYHGGAAMVVWGPEQNCTSDALSVATDVSSFSFQVMTGMATAYAGVLKVPIIEGSVMYQVAGSLPGYAVPTYTQLALTIEVDPIKEPGDKREGWLVDTHTAALNRLLSEIKAHVRPRAEVAASHPTEVLPDCGGYLLSYDA